MPDMPEYRSLGGILAAQMDEYRFELAAPRDAAAIASLSRRLIEAGLPPAWPTDRVLCHIKRTDSVVVTARIHGLLAGFAIMQFGDSQAHLNLLAVESAYQRRGLGRQLVNWLHESALVAGTFLMWVWNCAPTISARSAFTNRSITGPVTWCAGTTRASKMPCA
jgi:ribosomal protein S18 acetylase RimI-like enzyme